MKIKDMKRGEFEETSGELWMDDDFAEIYGPKHLSADNDNGVRLYHSSPGVMTFQIRTHKGINDMNRGKPRNMIAHTRLTIEDLEKMLAYAKKKLG